MNVKPVITPADILRSERARKEASIIMARAQVKKIVKNMESPLDFACSLMEQASLKEEISAGDF